VANINHKVASGSALRPLAKSRAGRESRERERGEQAGRKSGEKERGERAGRKSGERERGARPCGVTVRGCIPRVSLRRIPKEVVDCLKFVVFVYFHREGKQSEVI
jgi:hypothetical protein